MKKLLILFLSLMGITMLMAGNSIFSYNGYPCRYYGNDIYSMGMGDVGLADTYRLNTGYGNPAMHGTSNQTLFSTGLMMGYTQYSSQGANVNQFTDNSIDFPYFSIRIPIKNHNIGFQFNSFSSGVVANQTSFMVGNSQVIEKQSMDNYLYRGDLIYSYHKNNWYLGVSGNYYFGHDIHFFSQSSDDYFISTWEQLTNTYKNPSVTVGIIKSFNKFSLGVDYSKQAKLTGTSSRLSRYTTGSETENLGNYNYTIPQQIAFGITVKPAEEISVSSDIHWENWSAIDSEEYQDSYKIGLGIAREPNPDKWSSFGRKIPLRAGFSYRLLPFKTADNNIDEMIISSGLSIPLNKRNNRIDLGIQWTMRGNADKNLLQEKSIMMLVGITGFDIITRHFGLSAPREIPKKEELSE